MAKKASADRPDGDRPIQIRIVARLDAYHSALTAIVRKPRQRP